MRPFAPAPPSAIRNFIRDDPDHIRLYRTRFVRVDIQIGISKSDALSTSGEFAAEIPESVRRVQVRIMRDQICRILRDNKVIVWREHRLLRKCKIDSRPEAPAADVNGLRSLVIKLDLLIIVTAGNRLVHEFVDN